MRSPVPGDKRAATRARVMSLCAGLFTGLFTVLFTVLATACLEPLVDDTVVASDLILPPGAELSSVYQDVTLAERIALEDGVDGVVPLISAFAEGQPIEYWDFGPAPSFAAPLFYLMDPATGDPVGHPGIVATLPGDPGYSPYWAVFSVPVTDAYQGEIIPSVDALEAAERLGLVGAPEATGLFANCPVVAEDVVLEMPDGSTLAPPHRGYHDGRWVSWYDMVALQAGEMRPLESDGVTVPVADLYRLRREGGEPLSENVRNVDMTGDGDTRDSNDILAQGDAVERRVIVEVVVPAGYMSIDTSGDQSLADYQRASDVFQPTGEERVPVSGNVIAYRVEEASRNLVVRAAGVP